MKIAAKTKCGLLGPHFYFLYICFIHLQTRAVMNKKTSSVVRVIDMCIFSLLLLGCTNDERIRETKVKDSTIESQNQKLMDLEKKVVELEAQQNNTDKSKGDYSGYNDKEQKTKRLDYFTIGSTEYEVLNIQGEPTAIHNLTFSKIYDYGSSTVTFTNGQVESFSNTGNLKIKVNPYGDNHSLEEPQKSEKTTFVYCVATEFEDNSITGPSSKDYYSKIFKISNYNDDTEARLKECFLEELRKYTLHQPPLIQIAKFDTRTKAVKSWQLFQGEELTLLCPEFIN
jgi:hypothetical protein